MLKKFKYKEITWIDLESPTPEEIEALASEYKLNVHPLVKEELAHPLRQSKFEAYRDHLFLVLHFPPCQMCAAGEAPERQADNQEIDLVIGKDFLITVHYEPLNYLSDFAKILESHLLQDKKAEEVHPGYLAFFILREIYANLAQSLNFINDQLRLVEKKIFSGQERAVVKTLSLINRELLDFQWDLRGHRQILAAFEAGAGDFFGGNVSHYLRLVCSEHEKIYSALKSNRNTFSDLRETNDSLLSIKTNETAKTLTALAFILLPITIISQIFGMTMSVPFIATYADFIKVISLMGVVTLATYALARSRQWI
jgi:magnesium transporter